MVVIAAMIGAGGLGREVWSAIQRLEAATNTLAAALKQAGYDTRLTPVSGAAMWEAVVSCDADAMVAAWLPATHAAYYAKLKNKVDVLEPNIEGAKIGWVVPDYVTVDSIADLKANAPIFGGKIIGIDPGAGLMRASETAMTEYALAPMQLVDGSDATMVAALKDAVSRKPPVVVTGWTPHWMWAAFKLKYLADPKNVFGGDETVNNVVRKGLAKEHAGGPGWPDRPGLLVQAPGAIRQAARRSQASVAAPPERE